MAIILFEPDYRFNGMLPEYYWFSLESVRQNCRQHANPGRKKWIRFMPTPEGGFDTVEREWTPPALNNAPGYYTLMCVETGQIFHYTERLKKIEDRPPFKDAVFVGQYRFHRTILLRHKDGTLGHYSVGYNGLQEQELTPDLARYVIKICQEARAPVPIIKMAEAMRTPPAPEAADLRL